MWMAGKATVDRGAEEGGEAGERQGRVHRRGSWVLSARRPKRLTGPALC